MDSRCIARTNHEDHVALGMLSWISPFWQTLESIGIILFQGLSDYGSTAIDAGAAVGTSGYVMDNEKLVGCRVVDEKEEGVSKAFEGGEGIVDIVGGDFSIDDCLLLGCELLSQW